MSTALTSVHAAHAAALQCQPVQVVTDAAAAFMEEPGVREAMRSCAAHLHVRATKDADAADRAADAVQGDGQLMPWDGFLAGGNPLQRVRKLVGEGDAVAAAARDVPVGAGVRDRRHICGALGACACAWRMQLASTRDRSNDGSPCI
jgi:hypothetical protein